MLAEETTAIALLPCISGSLNLPRDPIPADGCPGSPPSFQYLIGAIGSRPLSSLSAFERR